MEIEIFRDKEIRVFWIKETDSFRIEPSTIKLTNKELLERVTKYNQVFIGMSWR